MNDRTNNFKYLINKYQIGRGLVENINITVINSVLKDPTLTIASLALLGAVSIDMLKVLKEHIIYYFNNYHEQNKSEEHEKIKKLYNQYVKELAKYLKNDDPINIGVNFTIMLWDGDLSYDKFEFSDKNDRSDDSRNIDIIGLKVILGEAVCRNISGLLCDIYKELGYE